MNVRPLTAILLLSAMALRGQTAGNERSFSAPVSSVQAMLKKLPGGTSGQLPVLDGFVVPGTRSLDHFSRPYYQCTVRVTAAPGGGSVVRVAAKITAWNDDTSHARYEVLESNGRIEADLLDRLQEFIDSTANTNPPPEAAKSDSAKPGNANPQSAKQKVAVMSKPEPAPEISAPVRQLPSLRDFHPTITSSSPPSDPLLQQEAKSLEDILRNQAHPTNLVAVKQEHTAVLQNPRTDATVLFLADAEDEFEVLDENPNWVYVRISGLSRGWIRRSSVQPIDSSGAVAPEVAAGDHSTDAPPFAVSSEELGNFPGKWAPLEGKSVKIISVQQTGPGHGTSAEDKLHFAETQFKQTVPSSAAGVVLIFDSEDGGMVAATLASLEQWKKGALSDKAFWSQCYFDPPEIFASINP